MNIDNKKTALDDDASIYQRVESTESSKSERQKLSELSFKGKLRYLWDYYAVAAGLILFFGGLIVATLIIILKPKPNTVANFAIFDSPWIQKDVQAYSEEVLKHLGLDKSKNEVVISDGYSFGSSTDGLAISTHIYAGDLDFIIGTFDAVQLYADNSIFLALDELPEDIQKAIADAGRVSSEKAEEGVTRDYAFSLRGTAFELFVNSTGYETPEMYIGLCTNSNPDRRDDVLRVLRFIVTGS